MQRSVGGSLGISNIEYKFKGFILNCLEIIETADGAGIERDAWVRDDGKDVSFDKEGFGWYWQVS